MKVNFEFNFEELDNNELRINGRRTDFLSFMQWRSIIIKKEWITPIPRHSTPGLIVEKYYHKKRVDILDNNHIEESYLVGL